MLSQEIKLEPLSIKAVVERRGLVFLGAVDLELREDHARYTEWLKEGRQADMVYLESSAELRRHPEVILPGARSAVAIGLRYETDRSNPGPQVAGYALYRDYHRVLRKVGAELAEELAAVFPNAKWRAVADSAPILERALAAKGGYGFIGKNTCYIHHSQGSLLLLAEILTDIVLPTDGNLKVDAGGCNDCTICQVECPTGALNTDYQIDSRLCLSYWTIENRGVIPPRFWPYLATYWYGCDSCQVVCPYNGTADKAPAVRGFDRIDLADLYEVAVMDQPAYVSYFSGTALTRAKREGLKRNALIALFVTKHPRFLEALEKVEAEKAAFPLPETCEALRRAMALAER